MHSGNEHTAPGILRSESGLWIGAISAVLFTVFGSQWLGEIGNPLSFAVLFVWLFTVMLWLAFGVVRHADSLAVLLGEPYGTLIPTAPPQVRQVSTSMLKTRFRRCARWSWNARSCSVTRLSDP